MKSAVASAIAAVVLFVGGPLADPAAAASTGDPAAAASEGGDTALLRAAIDRLLDRGVPGMASPVAATAPQTCVDGIYTNNYRIQAGTNRGDSWSCCVPLSELFRSSFVCEGISLPQPIFGTANDQKVQRCLLQHPFRATFVRACKPDPLRQ